MTSKRLAAWLLVPWLIIALPPAILAILLSALLVLWTTARAEDTTAQQLSEETPLPPKPRYLRLDSQLNYLVEELPRLAGAASGGALMHQDGTVAVTIRFSGSASDITAILAQGGATVANTGADYLEAYVPVGLLPVLDGWPGVLWVEAIVPPQPAVTSQGAAVHRATLWNTGGFTGAGVKVGIIDGGFKGYSQLMGTELPATVVARCYTKIGVFTPNLADCDGDEKHGTGVAEAVMDMAPNVSLYIANPQSTGDLQATATWMVSEGVKVINHSVGWTWQGPGDGTSPFSNSPLKTVDTAVAGGVLWVNAAGNSALGNWFGGYTDANANGWMEFASNGSEVNGVQLTAGQEFIAQARWKDSWSNAATNLDLYLWNSTISTIVALSNIVQSSGAGHIPYERLVFNPTTSGTYYLAVKGVSGFVPAWVQLEAFTGEDLEYAVATTSIGNPAESSNPGLLAVGAAAWNTSTTIESFSSRGPTTDGRVKPDIVGADGGLSVSYGLDGFFGTSQASPHVAGLAALVLERSPGFTPVQVAEYLKANALPRGAVPNNTWGYGFAQLPSLPPGPPTGVQAVAGNGAATVTWSAPSFDGGSPITHYTAISSPEDRTVTSTPLALSATVGGLTNGTSYTFTVTATNAAGISKPSASSNAVTPEAPKVVQSITDGLEAVIVGAATQSKAVLRLRVEKAVTDTEPIILPGGIRRVLAVVDYNPACLTVISAQVSQPFSSTASSIDSANGKVTLIADIPQGMSGTQPAFELAHLFVRFTGSATTSCTVSFSGDTQYRPGTNADSPTWPAKATVSQAFLRGDANGSGSVTILDSIYIRQYLAKLRSADQIKLLNAASPFHDPPSTGQDTGDRISIFDPILIQKYLAKLINEYYE